MLRLLRRLCRLRRLRRRLRRATRACASTLRAAATRLAHPVPLALLLAVPLLVLLRGSSRGAGHTGPSSVADEFDAAHPVLPRIANATAWSGAGVLSQPFAANLIVSERHRYIFCPIPKASSTAWKYLLRRLDRIADFADLRSAHSRNASGLRYLSDYSPADVDAMLRDPAFFKFVVVRSPLSRLLSAYLDKIANRDPTFTAREYRTFYAAAFGWRAARLDLGSTTQRTGAAGESVAVPETDSRTSERPSFAQFVDAISTQDPRTMNAHWRPQTLLCGLGVMPYHYVAHVESLAADVPRILARIGAAGGELPSSEAIGFPPSGASRPGLVDKMYTRELRAMAHQMYATDFALLHYNDTMV